MLDLCFEAVLTKLNVQLPRLPTDKNYLADTPAIPLFVTWKRKDILLGCIGTLEVKKNASLRDVLIEYAILAAFNDKRFNGVSAEDIPELICEVTFLTDFEPITDIRDWTIGTHGIEIHMPGYSAVYLPNVITENEWDKETTIRKLKEKSGWKFNNNESESWWAGIRFRGKKEIMIYT